MNLISNLRVAKTATFHKVKQSLSDASVNELFLTIRRSRRSPGRNLLRYVRVSTSPGSGVWSAISFLYTRQPSFLIESMAVSERICGFLFILEYRDHLAIFKSHLEIPSSFSDRYLGRVSPERIDVAVTRQDAVFKRLRLRNLSLSKYTVRNKSFEADELNNILGPAASGRYVPQSYSLRSGDDHYSATASTGRISKRSDRVNYQGLINYAQIVINDFVDRVDLPAPFIGSFARPVDFATIAKSALPLNFGVDVADLEETILEREEIRLVRTIAGVVEALNTVEVVAVLTELAAVLDMRPEADLFGLYNPNNAKRVGTVARNSTRFALRALSLPLSADIEVERTTCLVGEDEDRILLSRYIDRGDRFTLLFDDVSLGYVNGVLLKDPGLLDGGTTFLRYLRVDPLLSAVVDEKGKTFTSKQTKFNLLSTFGVVVKSVAAGDDVLVCDDLGNEWADFIGLNSTSSPRRISFYHAKHGKLSLGAGPFHISVSQAIKNLCWMNLSAEAVKQKLAGWQSKYKSGSGVQTSINNVIRKNSIDLEKSFELARHAPDAIRRVFIVTSSLSKSKVEDVFTSLSNGGRPDPHFVQLYWLILSYVSACNDMNTFGYIVCRP